MLNGPFIPAHVIAEIDRPPEVQRQSVFVETMEAGEPQEEERPPTVLVLTAEDDVAQGVAFSI